MLRECSILMSFGTVHVQKRKTLILISVGLLEISHSVNRYILCVNFLIPMAEWIQSYILLTETVLITQFSPKREGVWVPDCDAGKNQDENLHVCHHL